MAKTTLLDLPNELLLQLPHHMRDLEDLMHLSSSCRHLHHVLTQTPSKTILQLASRSAPTFFSPHPLFLAVATAQHVTEWTIAAPDTRTTQLIEAFRGGVPGLLELALQDDVIGVGLTMADVRRVCAQRFSVINPLNATIDAMIGSEWYRAENFWNGGVDDAFTLYADVNKATMELLLYGEMFGSTMQSFLAPQLGLPRLDVDTRIEFIKYCIPDWSCAPDNGREDGFEVLPVGPYALRDKQDSNSDSGAIEGNQTSLAHLLGGAMFRGTLWKKAWRRLLLAAGCFHDAGWPKSWQERIRKMDPKRARSEINDAQNVGSATSNTDADQEAGGERDGNVGVEEVEETDADQESENENEPYDEDTELWRFKLFWDTLTQLGGLEGMEMVAQFKGQEEGRDVILKPEWRARILEVRDQVLALTESDRPSAKNFGKRQRVMVSQAPDPSRELYICCSGLWSGL